MAISRVDVIYNSQTRRLKQEMFYHSTIQCTYSVELILKITKSLTFLIFLNFSNPPPHFPSQTLIKVAQKILQDVK